VILLSIIIPTFNEEDNPFFIKTLANLSSIENIEVIIADGGSKDQTQSLVAQYSFHFFSQETSSRAARINLGILNAQGAIILLHHPRSILEIQGIEKLKSFTKDKVWGGFTHRFDIQHPLLKFTSWYSNNIRPRWKKIIYLDHCIFFTRETSKDIFPISEVDIFEDTIISKLLYQKLGSPIILPYHSTTWAIRFIKNGVVKQAVLNQYLKLCYYLKIDHKKMNQQYEKNAKLNSKYKDL